MPVVYKCKGCGYTLFVFERVGQDRYGIPTPSEVIAMYDGRCPACGRRLEAPRSPKDVRVEEAPEKGAALLVR